MASTTSKDRGREIAKQALSAQPDAQGNMLEAVARYCIRELATMRTESEMEDILASLSALNAWSSAPLAPEAVDA